MGEVTYTVIEHDGGWAYRLGDVFSETFRTRLAAEKAAEAAAAEQEQPGNTEAILYQDERGRWHEELSRGEDRPQVHVEEDGKRLR